MSPEKDRATATGDKHEKFGEDRWRGSGDRPIRADRHTDTLITIILCSPILQRRRMTRLTVYAQYRRPLHLHSLGGDTGGEKLHWRDRESYRLIRTASTFPASSAPRTTTFSHINQLWLRNFSIVENTRNKLLVSACRWFISRNLSILSTSLIWVSYKTCLFYAVLYASSLFKCGTFHGF